MFLGKGVLKMRRKFTGEHPYGIDFIEIALWHVCSPVNLVNISRAPFPKNTSGWLLRNNERLKGLKTLKWYTLSCYTIFERFEVKPQALACETNHKWLYNHDSGKYCYSLTLTLMS